MSGKFVSGAWIDEPEEEPQTLGGPTITIHRFVLEHINQNLLELKHFRDTVNEAPFLTRLKYLITGEF